MNWRQSVPMDLLLLAGCAGAEGEELAYFSSVVVYEASPEQERIDRSFSDMPIQTPLAEVRDRLTEIPFDGCEDPGECDWRDPEGVRHYFFDGLLVVKHIDAADFAERPILALEIGSARERNEVLQAARRFVPEAYFDCFDSGDDTESCQAYFRPGWLTIRFDARGLLTQVKLDGYHFT